MELVFAYGAGLLTLINPCVLPVLPIVLATALQANRSGPLLLAIGMNLSFVMLGLTVAAFGHALGLNEDDVSRGAAVVMIGFGLILLVARFAGAFATVTAGFSRRADDQLDGLDQSSPVGLLMSGALLGAVWSPCVGPTLGGAISLASQGQSLGYAGAIMASFALGVSTVILLLGHGARSALQRHQSWMRQLAVSARPILGGVFVAVGLILFFRLHYVAEAWLLDHMPVWLLNLSVSL